jgi:hypothetical protein
MAGTARETAPVDKPTSTIPVNLAQRGADPWNRSISPHTFRTAKNTKEITGRHLMAIQAKQNPNPVANIRTETNVPYWTALMPVASRKNAYAIFSAAFAKDTDSKYESNSPQNRQLLIWSAHVHALGCSFASVVIACPFVCGCQYRQYRRTTKLCRSRLAAMVERKGKHERTQNSGRAQRGGCWQQRMVSPPPTAAAGQ